MKPQRMVLLAVAFVAAGAAGCFKDPVKPLRSGGTLLSVSHQAIYLHTGDSVAVVAELKDNQGNVLPADGAAWSTGDAAIAAVRMDTVVVPGNYFTRAFIRGVTATGGWTSVIVSVGNVADTLRVVVFPARLITSLLALSGTSTADTVVIPAQIGPPPVAAQTIAYTALDTLVLSGTSVLNFDTSKVSVYVTGAAGTSTGYVVAKTPTQIKVSFTAGAMGKVVVKNLLLATANASVGTLTIDSLVGDSTRLSRTRFRGAISQVADTMTATASANQSFSSSSGVRFGTRNAIVLSQTATALKVISPVNYTGQVTVTNVKMGTATLPSIVTNAATPYTINAATFAGTVTTTGNELDTVKVYSGGVTKFTTTPSGSVSNISMNGVAAFVLLRTADSMYVIAKRSSTGPLAISNVTVGSAIISSLNTASNVIIGPATGELNEPGNDTRPTATVLAFTGATDTITVYGAIDCEDDGTACPGNGDVIDYYQIAYTGGQKLRAILTWFGNGTGGPSYSDTNNPDLDVAIRDASGGFLGTGTSTNGSGLLMPEIATTSTVLAAGTYYFRVLAWLTPSPAVYQLKILRL